MNAHLMLVITLALLPSSEPTSEARKELDRFEGSWKMVDGERDGQKLAQEHIKAGRIRWHKGRVSVDTPHQSSERIESTATVDPSQTPKHMDWVRHTGPGKGQTFHAIYEFITPDEYRVCFSPPGQERPKEFRTQPGTGQMMHTWRRVGR